MLTASPSARQLDAERRDRVHAARAAIRLLDRFETNRFARQCHEARFPPYPL